MNTADNVIPIEGRARTRLLAEAIKLVDDFIRMVCDNGAKINITVFANDEHETLRGWAVANGYMVFENGQVKRFGQAVVDLTNPELSLEELMTALRDALSQPYP